MFYLEAYPNTISWHIILERELLINGGIVCALLAFVGLVLAKCYDRRWLALYALGVTVAAMTGYLNFFISGMYISTPYLNILQSYIFSRLLRIGVVGFIGTGVALC